MIFGIPIEQLVPLANFLGVCFLGLLAAFGIRWGQKRATFNDNRDVEVAGAIVDSGAILKLAAAIEAQTMERIAARQDAEKGRQCAYRLIDALCDVTKEMEEMRKEVRELGNMIARKH